MFHTTVDGIHSGRGTRPELISDYLVDLGQQTQNNRGRMCRGKTVICVERKYWQLFAQVLADTRWPGWVRICLFERNSSLSEAERPRLNLS